MCVVVIAGVAAATTTYSRAGDIPWNIKFDKVSGNSALGMKGYRSMQGIAFDTYTGADGYAFMESDKENTAFILSHFSMDSSGFCTQIQTLKYKAENLGHANDATIYQDENGVKWLIFAACGKYDEDINAVSSDGVQIKVGAIKLSEFSQGVAKVYACDTTELAATFGNANNDNKGNITGVAYTGMKYTDDGKKVPIMIAMNGKTMHEAILTMNNGQLALVPTGASGRIEKPTLPSGTTADTQGIVYHNNYVYLTGEGKGAKAAEMVVGRISLSKLFDGDERTYKAMEVYKANNKTKSISKHGPEAAFFTSLNEKSNLYIGVNRVYDGKDDDAIMRTPMRF